MEAKLEGEGKRVKLVFCNDPYTRVKVGTLGTVLLIDPVTQVVHVNWDDGRNLGLVPGVDQWEEL
jgi:hypothetical protein